MTTVDDLRRSLAEGRITRREFLARASALGIGAAAASAMACSSDAPSTSETPGGTSRKGGRFRVGTGEASTADTLDPAAIGTFHTVSVSWALNNCLTEIDEHGEAVPELAEDWEHSPDVKEWRFKVRPGVTFHNGKSLAAEDVVASINHHRGADSTSTAKAIVDLIEDIHVDGQDTVVISLAEPNLDLPYFLSAFSLTIKPSKDGIVEWQSGVGTGGYTLESYEPGVRALLRRNPNYWKDGRAHFEECEVLAIADVTARTNALATGEIDAMDRCELKTVHLLERSPGLKVVETEGTLHYTAPMRCDTEPFDNKDVRLALKHAVDREALLQGILRGHGTLGNDHPIARTNRFYASEIPQREYDPDKAKFHLKRAGLSGLEVSLSAADGQIEGAIDMAVLYREHAAATGIQINVVREPADAFWSTVWMKKPWCVTYWAGRPTEDWIFTQAYSAESNWNDTFWRHERFNQLLKEARRATDEAKRRDLYTEMQLIVRDEGGTVVPFFANYVCAMSERVQHGPLAVNWRMDGMKCLERWWFV